MDIKQTSFKIRDVIWKKLEEHLGSLKKAENKNYTKQRWMLEAVREKLEREKDLESTDILKEYERSVSLFLMNSFMKKLKNILN